MPPRNRLFIHAPWKKWTSKVENQKTEPHCMFFAMADMMTIVLRMCKTLDLNSFISAQCLIDSGRKRPRDLIELCVDEMYGVETTETYPYERVRRWSYEPQVEQRYTLEDIDYVEVNIKDDLIQHFRGRGYPCVGILNGGELHRRRGNEEHPYRHPPGLANLGQGHAVVILGVELEGDSLCCHIRNSWGHGWAREGYDDVGVEVFTAVLIPFHHSFSGSIS